MLAGSHREVLVVGAGVIGTVYAARLAAGGLEVSVLARGERLRQIHDTGAIVVRLPSNQRLEQPVHALAEVTGGSFGLILVAVRREQVLEAAAQVASVSSPRLLFFGNYAGMEGELAGIAGSDRSIFGFPGVGGIVDGSVVRYVQIPQQPTTLGRSAPANPQADEWLADAFRQAGFQVVVVTDMAAWLDSHAALVVPIAAAIRAAGGTADALAGDPRLLHLMVLATREAYSALGKLGRLAIPFNLRFLYRVMPAAFVQWYWARTLRGQFGELAFAAHTRHAWPELAALGERVEEYLRESSQTGRAFQELLRLATAADPDSQGGT